MATVFCASGARLRGERRDWVRQLISVLVAVVIAVVLAGKDAEAQTMAGTPPSSGVSWSVGPGSSPASASMSGSNMAMLASIAVTASLYGVTQVWPLGRTLTAGASLVGSVGRTFLQSQMARGALTGAALAAALALTGDTFYDPASNSFLYRKSLPGQNGTVDCSMFSSYPVATYGYGNYQNKLVYVYWHTDINDFPSGWTGNQGSLYCTIQGSPRYVFMAVPPQPYTPPAANTSPATNAQIEAAIAASPSAMTGVFNAAGCPNKINSYIDLNALSGNSDPCAMLVVGASGGAATAPTSNNPYGWPVQSWSIATSDGKREAHSLAVTTTIAGNTGADNRSNPVSVQTTGVDTKTSTDAAGNTTTTTTTTTAPAQTKPGDVDKDGTATFAGSDATLYTKKTRTFSDVLQAFQASLSNAPWIVAGKAFFNVTIGSASCPHWSVAGSRWLPAMDASPYVCSSTMMALYQVGGAVVLAVAAWAAFRIAFL